MNTDNLNKDTILKLFELLPVDQLQVAISSLENEAIKNEKVAQKHLDEAKRLRADVLELKTALSERQGKQKNLFEIVNFTASPLRNTYSGGNFGSRITKLFNDGIPKTGRELLNAHTQQYGPIKYKAFTSQLSTFVKESKTVKFSPIVTDNGSANYYGLFEWFDEVGNLSKMYKEKIKTVAMTGT